MKYIQENIIAFGIKINVVSIYLLSPHLCSVAFIAT
jgi:hypothetical protein